MKYFYFSFFILFAGLVSAYFLGGFSAVYITFLLCILEISLSFDNAVINASVLNLMSEIWRKRFILWGILIAVFGMRFLFPLLIVSISAQISIFQTLNLAIYDPQKYGEILSAHKDEIYAFGGAFLLMVAVEFFFDKDREIYWIKPLENGAITKFLRNISNISTLIALAFGLILVLNLSNLAVALAYFSAIFAYIFINSVSDFLSKTGAKSGLAGFIYLETLDASFSFDGVIGAFALSENIFIIMIGLGAGAMFVRSMTIFLVEKGTLSEFIYLEHGAHYAIFALSAIMFLKLKFEVSELITGTIGFVLILAAFLSSLLHNHAKN